MFDQASAQFEGLPDSSRPADPPDQLMIETRQRATRVPAFVAATVSVPVVAAAAVRALLAGAVRVAAPDVLAEEGRQESPCHRYLRLAA